MQSQPAIDKQQSLVLCIKWIAESYENLIITYLNNKVAEWPAKLISASVGCIIFSVAPSNHWMHQLVVDHTKTWLLLWIIFVIYVSCLSCFLVCSLQTCGHLLEKGWPLCFLVCYVLLCFATLSCGVLGQVCYLIVSIPDLCLLTYFEDWHASISPIRPDTPKITCLIHARMETISSGWAPFL